MSELVRGRAAYVLHDCTMLVVFLLLLMPVLLLLLVLIRTHRASTAVLSLSR